MSAMYCDIPKTIAALMEISKRFPREAIQVRILAGTVTVGFIKGEYGDEQAAAWGDALPAIGAQIS